MTDLADAVRSRLDDLDMSERELARRTSLSNETVNRIVNDGNPSLSSIRKVAEELNLDLGVLTDSPG